MACCRIGPVLDPVELKPDERPQVRLVVDQEVPHGRVRRGEVIEQLLPRREVLEVARGLLDQVLVDRAQARAQRVRHLGRVEILGQQRTPQRQQQVEELRVPLPAKTEQPRIDEVPVLRRGPAPCLRLQDRTQLSLGQRPGIG